MGVPDAGPGQTSSRNPPTGVRSPGPAPTVLRGPDSHGIAAHPASRTSTVTRRRVKFRRQGRLPSFTRASGSFGSRWPDRAGAHGCGGRRSPRLRVRGDPAILHRRRTLGVRLLPHSSRGPGHRPLKAETTGSNPVCGTNPIDAHASGPPGAFPCRARPRARLAPGAPPSFALRDGLMPAAPDRRLVILAEGNFGFHHGKTAMGVIRFGTDKVVAVIDSTQAGRNVREWLGDSGRYDIPIVDSLNAALGFLPRADALLIGIAPTGGRLPDEWRAMILAAIRSGLDILSGLHTFLGDDPEFADAARSRGRPARRLPPAAGADGDGRRAAPRARQAGDPHRRHRLRDRQDVRRAGAAARGRSRPGRSASFVPTGPDRDDDRGLGRGRRPGHQRLRPGHRRVAGRGGRAARATGSSSRARARWTTRPTAASRWGSSTATTPHAMVLVHKPGHGRPRLRPPAGAPVPDRASCRRSSRSTRRSRGSSRRRRSSPSRSTRRSIPDEDEARRIDRGDRGRDRAARRRPGPLRRDALWREIETAVDALPWVVPAEPEAAS